jgi:hypothetical protein
LTSIKVVGAGLIVATTAIGWNILQSPDSPEARLSRVLYRSGFAIWYRLFRTFYIGDIVNSTINATGKVYNRRGLGFDLLVNLWLSASRLPLIGRWLPGLPALEAGAG